MPLDYKKEFCNKVHEIAVSRGQHEVFVDFCELSMIVLRQPFEKSETLESRFHEILKPYSKEAVNKFTELLRITVEVLQEKPHDFLGECFHALNLHNHFKGQFFTPYHISDFMAEITLANVREHVEKHSYVSLSEPACGAGAMVIAAAEVMKKHKLNPVNSLWVVAQDIDFKCCCMAYIQMTLLAIPGVVIWGNSLINEKKDYWITSGYYLYPWAIRFATEKQEPTSVPSTTIKVDATGQMEFNFEGEIQ